MIADFATLIREQSFPGVAGVHVSNVPEGARGCHIVVRRDATNRLNSLDGADGSLSIVNLAVEVTSEDFDDVAPVEAAITEFLDEYNGALGGSYVTDVEDFDEESEDGSPVIRSGVRLQVTLEHTPA